MSLVLTSGLVIDAGTQQPQVEPFGELKRCVARTFQGENQPGILELSGAGINKAIDWVNLHHRFRFGRKQAADVALVAGTQSVALAADFFAVDTVQLVRDGEPARVLEYVDWTQFNQLEPAQTMDGAPQYWTAYNAFDNNEILLYPTPDASAASEYTLRLTYYERIQRPGADEDIVDAPRELGYVLCTYAEYFVAYARDRENVAAWGSKKREAERALARFVNSVDEQPGATERVRLQWDVDPVTGTFDPLR